MSLKIDTEDQKPLMDNTNAMLSSPPSKTYTSLSPQIPSSSMVNKALPPTTQTSPEQTSKNFKVRMLSPQTPKQKIESMLEKMELNTKNFPSKTQVCKGESSDKIHFFSPQHSNSPIVNYYAGINHPSSNPGSVMAYYSPKQDYGNLKNTDVPFYKSQANTLEGLILVRIIIFPLVHFLIKVHLDTIAIRQ